LIALGFRPFFLLAWAAAGALVPAWLLILAGVLPAPAGLPGARWHGHELAFGFGGAVLCGFLLTSARARVAAPGLEVQALDLAGLLWTLGWLLVLATCGPIWSGPGSTASRADLQGTVTGLRAR